MATDNRVPHAKKSPRNADGVIYWYEGDTFPLKLSVVLKDDSKNVVSFCEGDKLEVVFFTAERKTEICRKEFKDISSGEIVLDFNDELTGKFRVGQYVYDVIYKGAYKRTIAKNNRIVVE